MFEEMPSKEEIAHLKERAEKFITISYDPKYGERPLDKDWKNIKILGFRMMINKLKSRTKTL